MYLIVFDCDGTMVDSQHTIVACMTRAFTANGLTPPTRAAVISIVGLSLHEAVAQLAPGLDDARIAAIVAAYKGNYAPMRDDPAFHEPLFPGCATMLDTLHAHDDFVLGVATGKSRRGVAHLVERHGWQNRFATVQTADTNPSKPHPAMMRRAMAETGVAPQRTVLIGDTTYDMEMARAAGAHAIAVNWGYHPTSALKAAGTDHILTHFDELLPYLQTRLWT